MTIISQLDVINEMLGSMGESPVNTVDEAHPLAASGLRLLRVANLREQGKGWWFNKETITLSPDPATGNIALPTDMIRVDPTQQSLAYVQRGRRLYKSHTPNGDDPFRFSGPVTVSIIRLVPFEDLPPYAALVVSYTAQTDFLREYDADSAKISLIREARTEALLNLNAEHIRSVGANLLTKNSTLAAFNTIGLHANPAGYPLLHR